MKNILIAIALLVSSTVAAQSLKVTVLNDLSQPMSFAYLYLNGKPMLVTDSLGQAILPQTMMQAGDTLSAVVIGTNPVNAICDSLLNREEYTFIINEIYNSYDIDEVIVTTDIRKIYLKSTKLLPTIIYNCELFANFEIEDQISGCRAQGSCTATNIPYSKYYQSWSKGYFHRPIKIVTKSDTIGCYARLDSDIRQALQFSVWATQMTFPAYFSKESLKFGYLGVKDGQRIFRTSYSDAMQSKTDMSVQALIFVDVETKFISHIDMKMLNLENSRVFTTSMDCRKLVERTMAPIQQPITINWRFEDPATGKRVVVNLTDCRIQHKASLYREQ